MLLTFEIVLRERHILLQRDAKILMRDSIYALYKLQWRSYTCYT